MINKKIKLKVDPAHILLFLVACIFAFGPLWLSYKKHTNFLKHRANWIEIDMPGGPAEEKIDKETGFKYISSTDGSTLAVVTLIPSGPESEVAQALKSGPLEIAQVFSKIFPKMQMSDMSCELDVKHNAYRIHARNQGDRWHIHGFIKKIPRRDYAVVMMCYSRLNSDAKYVLTRMLRTMQIWYFKLDRTDIPDDERLSEPAYQ